ncbi:MAG: HD domain-containing protein [Nitrospirae bacterium]|nr:MAG: HD domain-containing protein [Nitrospirota bacterium]
MSNSVGATGMRPLCSNSASDMHATQQPDKRTSDVMEPCHPDPTKASPFLEELALPHPVSALIARIETTLPALRGHGYRTSVYAEALGRACGFSETALFHLRQAAYLHDIGLTCIPSSILRHPGPLSGDDYAIAQSHPRHAVTLLAPWPSLRLPAIWIAHHHERWDGAGYPFGLRGDLIPVESRIIAIADAFDQLCIQLHCAQASDRSLALRLLRTSAHSQFDPQLLDQFCRLPHPILVPVDGLSLGMLFMGAGKRLTENFIRIWL